MTDKYNLLRKNLPHNLNLIVFQNLQIEFCNQIDKLLWRHFVFDPMLTLSLASVLNQELRSLKKMD